MIKIDYKTDNLDYVLERLYLNNKPLIKTTISNLINNGYSKQGILYTLSKKDVQLKLEIHQSNEELLAFCLSNEVKRYAFKKDKR